MNSRTESITTFLFDWDGTLVDSAQLGLIAFQKSFAGMGLEFSQQTYEKTYSPTWYSMYEAMGLPREKWEAADRLWIQHYGEQTPGLVDGADEVVEDLRRKGYRLGVVSSGSDCRVSREIEQLGLSAAFEVIICNEHMINKKPHPEGLQTAMKRTNSASEETCYVGDSPEDVEMGRSAKVLTVGVRSTYPTSWKLQSAGPDIYLATITQLTSHFQ